MPRVRAPFSTFYVRMDSKSKVVERDVSGLLEIFGTVGGIQALLVACIGYVYGFFSRKALIGQLAREFFMVKSRPSLVEIEREKEQEVNPKSCRCYNLKDLYFSICWCTSSAKK
jgi:hypothetical protein